MSSVVGVAAAAQAAEAAGCSTFAVPDHFGSPFAPLVALSTAAVATTELRLTTTVLAHDFRHPAVLAKELATLDVVSGGRVEIGIGAGWMQAEYEQVGLTFDPPSVRIRRLEEYLAVLKGVMADDSLTHVGEHFAVRGLNGTPKPVQRPHPPIMIGGGGRKILGLAGRVADIVSIINANRGGRFNLDLAELSPAQLDEKIGWVRDGAGSRFGDIELNVTLLGLELADDPESGAARLVEVWRPRLAAMGHGELSVTEVLESPVFAAGTVDDICEQLTATRRRFGISYFSVASAALDTVRDVVRALGRREG